MMFKASLSIRRYLFLLIGGLVLSLAVLQLLLLAYFNHQIEREVEQRGRDLSHSLVEIAIEQLPDDDVLITKRAHRSSQAGEPDNHPDIEIHLIDEHQEAEYQKHREQLKQKLHETLQRIEQQVEQEHIVFERHRVIVDDHPMTQDDASSQALLEQELIEHTLTEETHVHGNGPDPTIKVTKAFTSKSPTLLDKFLGYSVAIIALTSLLALAAAYWLSHHFTRPLTLLNQGFKQLQHGDYGTQLPVTGTEDYRQTLNAFNTMSEQLAVLTAAEKRYQQQHQLAELGEVSRGLAHTLRNPIHTIGLTLEALQTDTLDPALRETMLATIGAKIQHINKTIAALLSLTTGNIDRQQTVPLNAVIQDVLLEVKSEPQLNHSANAVSIQTRLSTEGVNITGNEAEIRAIIHTLVVNAVEAIMQTKTIDGKIIIELQASDGVATVSVDDNGPGLSPQVAERLFEPHVTSKTEGAGMGLYIARRLVTLYYQGELTVQNHHDSSESNPGCRARVTFSQPSSQDSDRPTDSATGAPL